MRRQVQYVQSTLVISTSIISNNRLSRREYLILFLTQKSKIRLQNIVEKESNYIVICEIWLFELFFPQYYKSDMSKYEYLEVFSRVPSISR